MQSLIYVNLMGTFTVRMGNRPPAVLPMKSRALVAYLALQDGRAVTREAVSELLWPERDEKQARNSLKQELYVLRRDGFGGQNAIPSRDNAILLRPDSIACDVHELRKLIRPGSDAAWQTILGLYAGPLLEGFLPVSPAFDDWLAGMRRVLEADVLDALGRIADDGDSQASLAIAERMLAIDPLREDTHRRLIRCYAEVGRRTDALRIYNDARTLLRRDLDVAPAAETEALIARVRDGRAADLVPSTARQTVPAVPGHGPPRIAVLPLRQSEDQAVPSHISDGIIADIIAQLAGLREMTVISHGSTYGLRDPNMQPWEIGRKLNARYLVLGRIRRGGDRLRLTTELTEAETGQIVYSHTDDAQATLSFDEQDRIVGRLVNSLAPQVRETELRRIRGKRPNVLSVYEKVLLSRERIMLLQRDGFNEAKILLDEVIQEDPGYGEAYALAADWHGIMVGEGWSIDRTADIAAVENMTRIALDFDNSNLRALVSYAHRRSIHHRDHVNAMRMFQQALDVAPCSVAAWALSAFCFAYAGDGTEAVRRASRALELSPYDREAYKILTALCVAHYTNGNYEAAVESGRAALGENSVWRATMSFTAASLAALGRLSEAREITALIKAKWPPRRASEIMNSVAYQDVARRSLFAEHLRAAGTPE